MGTQEIRKQLDVFVKRVKKEYKPEKIILFGSYARGDAHDASDVDIVVIADSFKGVDPYDRFKQLYKLSNDLEPDFHTFGFTPEETKQTKKLPTLKHALHEGVILSQKKSGATKRYS